MLIIMSAILAVLATAILVWSLCMIAARSDAAAAASYREQMERQAQGQAVNMDDILLLMGSEGDTPARPVHVEL